MVQTNAPKTAGRPRERREHPRIPATHEPPDAGVCLACGAAYLPRKWPWREPVDLFTTHCPECHAPLVQGPEEHLHLSEPFSGSRGV